MWWAALASAIGAVLMVAGIPKIGDLERMTRAVRGYRILPDALTPVVATVLPWVEIVLGAALVLGVAPALAGAAAAVVFATFFVALTVNLARGRRELECGCFAFGAGREEIAHIGWWHAARAAGLAAAAAVTVATPATTWLDRATGAGIGLLVVAVIMVGGYARSVMTPGHRPVDDYLTDAAIELRAVSTLSRYRPSPH